MIILFSISKHHFALTKESLSIPFRLSLLYCRRAGAGFKARSTLSMNRDNQEVDKHTEASLVLGSL